MPGLQGCDGRSGRILRVRGIIPGIAGEVEDSRPEPHLIDPVCKDHRGYVLPDSHETVTVADLVGVHDIIPFGGGTFSFIGSLC